MQAGELVSLVAQHVGGGWSRVNILGAINRAQNEILGTDNEISRVKPDPFLTTSDGVFSYAASSSLFLSDDGTKGAAVGDVRSVNRVYNFSATIGTFGTNTIDPGSARPYQVQYGPNADRVESTIDIVQSKAPSSADCTIKWWEGNNPGDTTINWRAVAYLWPTQLTAEGIALTIPDDFADTLLLYAAMRRIEIREFGSNSDKMLIYNDELKRFKTKYFGAKRMDGELKARPRNC